MTTGSHPPTVFDALPALQRVTIYIDGDGWMLDHADDPSAADVLALFGSTVLPLPFLRTMREASIRDVLTQMHPGIVITRGEDR